MQTFENMDTTTSSLEQHIDKIIEVFSNGILNDNFYIPYEFEITFPFEKKEKEIVRTEVIRRLNHQRPNEYHIVLLKYTFPRNIVLICLLKYSFISKNKMNEYIPILNELFDKLKKSSESQTDIICSVVDSYLMFFIPNYIKEIYEIYINVCRNTITFIRKV